MKILLKDCLINNEVINVLIENQRISYVGKNDLECDKKIEVDGKLVIPGMIDPHTHIRDMNQSQKETWTTASHSAVSGGVTSLFDMPNTIPPTVNAENLMLKRDKAKHSLVNYGFNVGVTEDSIKELDPMLEEYKKCIASIKVFLTASSSNEYVSDVNKLKEIFKIGLKYDKPVIVHTEIGRMIEENQAKYSSQKYNSAIYHNTIRDREASIRGTKLVLDVSREVGNKIYVAHTSVKEELELIREYRDKYNVSAFCEVTPHHLILTEEILEKVGNYGKVNPPLRTRADVDALWEGIKDGTVNTVGSDHAPHEKDNKDKPYFNAPSGFPGLETSIPLLVNEMVKGRLTYEELVNITSRNTATIFNVADRGEIKPGNYADIIIVDTKAEYTIRAENFNTKAKYSPYEGMRVKGKVLTCIVNGNVVYNNGKIYKDKLGMELNYD